MLAFRDLHNGTVFVEANQPPSVVHMTAPGTVGVTLDESDLRTLLRVVEGSDPEPEKLTATRAHLAGEG
jgi:hypothetical protein